MPRKRVGRLTKKNKALAKDVQNEEVKLKKIPHSFIIHKGDVGHNIERLKRDFRKIMEPNTATKLKEGKKTPMKDYVALSGPLNVSHLLIFTRTEVGAYLKMCRMPRGPSLTFKIDNYTLAKDVILSLKNRNTYGAQFQYAPCLMTNLQSHEGDKHLQLVCRMFLDMFPTITPTDAKVSSLKRCCLLNYNDETEQFDLRHYSIKTVPVGVTKAVKKLLDNKVPDLSKYNSMSDYISKAGYNSESEAEDDPNNHIELKQKSKTLKSSVRLTELGPRITMTLIKVQDGLLDGTMLFHKFVHKTEEEKIELEKRWTKRRKLKEQRKKQQEENVEKKQQRKEEHKQKCIAGMNLPNSEGKDDDFKAKKKRKREDDDNLMEVDHVDDDAKYYEEEVGEKPEEGIFSKGNERTNSNYKKEKLAKFEMQKQASKISNNSKKVKQNKRKSS